jgi:hypothetical protein
MEQCRSCRAVLYRTCELGVSFFEGSCWQGGIYENAGIEDSWFVPSKRRTVDFQPHLGVLSI